MPVSTSTPSQKNIWLAAGDGDLERVRELVEVQSLSPNVPDPNTYTPMHAAASYGHLNVLEYLISQGGDVNVTDNDGDTPLYVVENIESARFLVEHGATVDHRNSEGISPAEYLEEDFPEIARYLQAIPSSGTTGALSTLSQTQTQLSQHAQNVASETLTTSLLQEVQDIMQRAEAEGRTVPDEELRQIVTRTVFEGVLTGYEISTESNEQRAQGGRDENGVNGVKRSRTDDGSG